MSHSGAPKVTRLLTWVQSIAPSKNGLCFLLTLHWGRWDPSTFGREGKVDFGAINWQTWKWLFKELITCLWEGVQFLVTKMLKVYKNLWHLSQRLEKSPCLSRQIKRWRLLAWGKVHNYWLLRLFSLSRLFSVCLFAYLSEMFHVGAYALFLSLSPLWVESFFIF